MAQVGKAHRRQLVNLTEGLIRSWGLGTERQGPQERRADDGTSRIAPSVAETEMPALCLSPRLLLPDASPSRQERLQAGGQRSAGGSRGIGAVSKRGRNGTDISAGPGYALFPAAAAEPLGPCPSLCDPRDGRPQAPPSLGFSRQEHWSGSPLPSPLLPDIGFLM